MPATISQELLDSIVSFHGHSCPGLAIGIRAALYARENIGSHSSDEEVVTITETDMCGVDAIQFVTGCTFGKGNLVFRDYGKVAFSFYNRKTGKSVRIRINPEMETRAEDKQGKVLEILQMPFENLFLAEEAKEKLPEKARILDSFICSLCGEKTMETRAGNTDGKKVCIPCHESGVNKS